jgi:hypothetical protein
MASLDVENVRNFARKRTHSELSMSVLQIAHLGVGSTGCVQIVENKLATMEDREAGRHIRAAKILHHGIEIDAVNVALHRYDLHRSFLQDVNYNRLQ